MTQCGWRLGFKVAVSVKSRAPQAREDAPPRGRGSVYYYAERDEEGKLFVQPLNAKHHPGGEKRFITIEKFLEHFQPEPLFFYNHVKPALDTVEAGLAKAENHLHQEQWDKAEKAYRRVLETDAENIRGIFGLGFSYLAAGKAKDAQGVFETVMRLELAFEPEHKHLFNRFGIAMRKAAMLEQAVDYFLKALAFQTGDENLHFNLARVHFDAGRRAECRENLELALGLNPDFQEARRLLAVLERGAPGPALSPDGPPGADPETASDIAAGTTSGNGCDTSPEPGLDIFSGVQPGPPGPPGAADASGPAEALLRYPGLDLDGLPWQDDAGS